MDSNKDIDREYLEQAGLIESLVATKGWEFVKKYIADRIQQFSNRAIIDGFKSMDEYQFYRGEVSGLRTLLVEIENNLTNLKTYREQHNIE